MPRRRAEELVEDLTACWNAAFDTDPVDLGSDIQALRRSYFDPVAQGQRLRRALSDVDGLSREVNLPESLALELDDDRRLITPEGRACLDLVREALRAGNGSQTVKLDDACAQSLEFELLAAYRQWTRHKLDQVIGLLGDENLRPPAIGLLVTMLVNRCVGASRALKRYPEGAERDAVDEAFRAPVGAFAEAVDPNRKRSTKKERLISGWTLGEVTRRYPADVVLDNSEPVGLVYIADGHEATLLDAAARALSRKHVGQASAGRGFDALVDELRAQRHRLSGYDMYFERGPDTARLRETLLGRLRERQAELADA
jgi:hypothetical protein